MFTKIQYMIKTYVEITNNILFFLKHNMNYIEINDRIWSLLKYSMNVKILSSETRSTRYFIIIFKWMKIIKDKSMLKDIIKVLHVLIENITAETTSLSGNLK